MNKKRLTLEDGAWKQVSIEDFKKFVSSYPKPLVVRRSGISEPTTEHYYDDKESMARIWLYEQYPKTCPIGSPFVWKPNVHEIWVSKEKVDKPDPQPGTWTITGPDGWTLTAAQPMGLMLAANKHQRELDPEEAARQAARLMAALKEESAEHEADMTTLMNRFLSWPLPDSVCTDLCTTKQGPYPGGRSGTNLLSGHEALAMLKYVLDCDEGDRVMARRKESTMPPFPSGGQATGGYPQCDGEDSYE